MRQRFNRFLTFSFIFRVNVGGSPVSYTHLDYSELLNALDSGASAKITINNRRIDKAEFEKSLLLPMKEDGLDPYRKEYNLSLIHI